MIIFGVINSYMDYTKLLRQIDFKTTFHYTIKFRYWFTIPFYKKSIRANLICI